LAIRSGKKLKVSRKYSFSDEASLSNLSFFIAHSFYARCPDGNFSRAEPPENNHLEVHQDLGGSNHQSQPGGRGHHQRSDSDTTVTTASLGNILNSLSTWQMFEFFLKVLTSFEWVLSVSQLTACPECQEVANLTALWLWKIQRMATWSQTSQPKACIQLSSPTAFHHLRSPINSSYINSCWDNNLQQKTAHPQQEIGQM